MPVAGRAGQAGEERSKQQRLKEAADKGRFRARLYKQDPEFPAHQDTVAVKEGWNTSETEERKAMLEAYLDELGVQVHSIRYDSTRVFDMIEQYIDACPEANAEMKAAPRHRTEFKTQMHSQTFFKSITPIDVPKDVR